MCGYIPGVTDRDTASSALPAPIETTSAAPDRRIVDAPETRGRTLLAIDTSLGTAVALCRDGVVFERSSDDVRGHTELIGELIAAVLDAAAVAPDGIDGVVAGIGPGPFTGLRIGIAAAHAFSAGIGAPLLPLVGHDAVALAVLSEGAASGVRVVQDAKRRELFVTEYRGLDWMGMPARSADPHLLSREALVPEPSDCWPDRVPAAGLVRIAARRLHSGIGFEADRALYLRQPDVFPPASPKRVSA